MSRSSAAGSLFGGLLGFLLMIAITILPLIGEVKCIIKVIKCDWKAPYKAEAIYGISAITGIGCITGWFNIEDGPVEEVESK